MNKRKDLKGLFQKWINNKENADFSVNIHFYEWSCTNRTPLHFYKWKDFEKFCKESKIEMNEWVKSSIRLMSIAHIACKKGKNELVIRTTLPLLDYAINTTFS